MRPVIKGNGTLGFCTRLVEVFPDPQDPKDRRAATEAANRRKCALHLYWHGRGNENPAVRGTVWAAYNGVTELIDHRKARMGGADSTSRRLHSVWFGRGAAIKARALRLATEWVESVAPS